jgi:hypothetical protein
MGEASNAMLYAGTDRLRGAEWHARKPHAYGDGFFKRLSDSKCDVTLYAQQLSTLLFETAVIRRCR